MNKYNKKLKIISFIKNKIDPIVFDLLKAGLDTYLNHVKIYILVIVSFFGIFGILNGLFLDLNLISFENFNTISNSLSFIPLNVQFAILALLTTIVTYYIAFRNTLKTGELGMEFNMQYDKRGQLLHTILYNTIALSYFLLWSAFFKTFFILIPAMSGNYNSYNERITSFIIGIIVIAFLIFVFFLFAVKYSYTIFLLEEEKVPLQAMDPLLILIGLFFGILISSLDFVSYFLNITIFTQIVEIVTYLTPGVILMPIFGFAMAHLKVASTIIGYENIFIPDKTPLSNNQF